MGNAPIINAIPTEYNGITFRSRTEARWAVFLDVLKIKWEYEAEGYQLLSGSYLPDFWVPEIDAFLEVKPEGAEEDRRWSELVALTNKRLFVTSGAPGSSHEMYGPNPDWPATELAMYCADSADNWYGPMSAHQKAMLEAYGRIGGYGDAPYFICQCATCNQWGCEFDGRAERIKCKCERPRGKSYTADSTIPAMNYAMKYSFWSPGGSGFKHISDPLNRFADHLIDRQKGGSQ